MIELKLDKIDRGSESDNKSSLNLGIYSTNRIEVNNSLADLKIEEKVPLGLQHYQKRKELQGERRTFAECETKDAWKEVGKESLEQAWRKSRLMSKDNATRRRKQEIKTLEMGQLDTLNTGMNSVRSAI